MKKWLQRLMCVVAAIIISLSPLSTNVFAASNSVNALGLAMLIKENGSYRDYNDGYSLESTISIDDSHTGYFSVSYGARDSEGQLVFLSRCGSDFGTLYCFFKYDIANGKVAQDFALFSQLDLDYTVYIPFDTNYSYNDMPATVLKSGNYLGITQKQQDELANTYLWLTLVQSDKMIKEASSNLIGLNSLGFTSFDAPSTQPSKPFTDIDESKYYYQPAIWAYNNGVTTGTGDGKFSPDTPCTRGQIVQFLYKLYGKGEKATPSAFSDVTEDKYYYDAVNWAVAHGITTGTGNGKFSPDKHCSRGQAVTFLMRTVNETPSGTEASQFKDVYSDNFFYEAVSWALENNITNGTGPNTFSPNADCTRGQIVTFLYKLCG